MSLIEEALRRIQDPLIAKHEAGAASTKPAPKPSAVQTPPAEPATPEPPAAHSWPTTTPLPRLPAASPSVNPLLAVSFSVLALTAVIVIGGAFWIGHHVVMRPTQVEITGASSRPRSVRRGPAPAAPVEAPAPASPSASHGLTLSGVVEGMGESYAVINGMIVGAGEQVGGATVLEVANGAVKLRRADGDELLLNVPR